MCETTDGTACPCSETPSAPTKAKPRRICETPKCGLVSGDTRFCRKCRAEAPLRAEMARRYDAHRREVEAYRGVLGGVVRHLRAADITGSSPEHAARLAAVALTEARDEVVRYRGDLLTVANHRDRLMCDWHDAATKRDEAVKALGVSRGIARGQEERLRRAKAEISETLDRLQAAHGERDAALASLHRLAAVDTLETKPDADGCEAIIRHELHERLALANRRREERDSATATVRQLTEQVGALRIERDALILEGVAKDNHANDLMEQRDDARGALGVARKESKALRTRLHIMYAVAVLLGVAAVVGGVL